MRKSRISGGILTTGITAGLCSVIAGFAVAAPNMVTFGDSVIANPSAAQAADNFCAHDPNNIPAQVSADLGLENRDWSCAGAAVAPGGLNVSGAQPAEWNTFSNQVATVHDANLMDDDTEVVLATIGFNDTYYIPANTDWTYSKYRGEVRSSLENGEVPPPLPHPLQPVFDAQKENWDREVDAAMPTIEGDAPNAEVVFSGYPAITSEHGFSCVVKSPLNNTVPVYIDWVTQSEQNANAWMQEAADRHGATYVDNRTATAEHNQCSGDASMFAGVVDFGTPGTWNIPAHPTQDGIDLISDNVVATLNGEPAQPTDVQLVAHRDQAEVQQPIYDGPPVIPGPGDELPVPAPEDTESSVIGSIFDKPNSEETVTEAQTI